MKKIITVILSLFLLLAGCSEAADGTQSPNEISVFYGVSSYAMFEAPQDVIDDLFARFNSLTFQKTSDEMDLKTAFHVSFSHNGSNIQSFWVDKNGIFWLNGKTQSYRISSGSFDYEYLKKIYRDSQKKELG